MISRWIAGEKSLMGFIVAASLLLAGCSGEFGWNGKLASPDLSFPHDLAEKVISGSDLVFKTAAQSLAVGACSSVATVALVNASGQPAIFKGAVGIGLSAPASGVTFFSDTNCSTAITSVMMQGKTATASFYFRGSVSGSRVVIANILNVDSAEQTETFTSVVPTPTPLPTPTPTPVPTPTPTPTATPVPTPSPTPTPGPSPASINMGETGILGAVDSGNGNLLLAQSTTLSQAGTLKSLSFYVQTAAGNLYLGVYDASGSGGGPGRKIAETAAFTPVAGWNTIAVVAQLTLPAGQYWLAYLPSSSSLAFRYGDGGSHKYYNYSFAQMPANFSASPNTGSGHWSFYGSLDVTTASPTPTPVPTPVPTPSPTPVPTPVPTPGPTPVPGGDLNLPRIPWEGGNSYYKASNGPQFAKADAAGWDEPTFFPILAFLPCQNSASGLIAAGFNTFSAICHQPPISGYTNTGAYVMAQDEVLTGEAPASTGGWTPSDVGSNPNVVSWFVSDECEMGYSGCTDWGAGDNGEYGRLSIQQYYVNSLRSRNDGRFMHANFGNGVVRTFWAPNTFDDHLALMDSVLVDKYAYTSPDVQDLLIHSPDWPTGANPKSSGAYGWLADQMRMFMGNSRKPFSVIVETARPLLDEAGAGYITLEQIEGAVWAGIIHEARSISYFPQNNATSTQGCTGGYSVVDCPAIFNKVKAINEKVKSLAPVLNTQSYYNRTFSRNGVTLHEYTFNNGTDAMLKTYGGYAYIFVGIGLLDSPGQKTFALPAGVRGTTVEVVGENRSIPVVNGSFTDGFAAEYTHHVYRILL